MFDKDGTLVDSLGPWAAAERALCEGLILRLSVVGAAERETLIVDMLAELGIRNGLVDRSGLMATGTSSAILSALRRRLETVVGEEIDSEIFRTEATDILARAYPSGGPQSLPMSGANHVLGALRSAGFPLALATSDDFARTAADLCRLEWNGYFRFLSCGDTALEPKPSPWSVLEFARLVGISPASIAVVGDTEVDGQMAESAGVGLYVKIIDSLSL